MNWKKEVEEFKKQLVVGPSDWQATSSIKFGFFGLVGGGKSTTAGILAVAITPEGPIGWIDGEGRRSKYAIDQVAELAEAHYGKPKQSFIDRIKVVHVDPPFNPLAGIAAIERLEEEGCQTIIADLCSQMWDSEGGYLDMREEEIDRMAGDDEAKRKRVMASASAAIKPWTHKKLVAKVDSSKANIILVFQAKAKWNPKTTRVDEFISPIQESTLTRTALAVGCVEQNEEGIGGFCKFQLPLGQGTKYTHPGILACLPKNGEQFKFSHGEAIAKWVQGSVKAPTKTVDPIKAAKAELWETLRDVRGKERTPDAAEGWLLGKGIIQDGETMARMSLERIREVTEKAKAILEDVPV